MVRSTHERSRRPSDRRARPRRAAVVVELILGLPVLIILLFAAVEFGLIYSAIKQVSYASRYGAKLASEEPRVTFGSLNTSNTLRDAIDDYLETAGLPQGACQVILQHTVSGEPDQPPNQPPPPDDCDCAEPTNDLPLSPEYVRVVVSVPLEGNVPDLLGFCGFGLEDRYITGSTTFRYEPDTP